MAVPCTPVIPQPKLPEGGAFLAVSKPVQLLLGSFQVILGVDLWGESRSDPEDFKPSVLNCEVGVSGGECGQEWEETGMSQEIMHVQDQGVQVLRNLKPVVQDQLSQPHFWFQEVALQELGWQLRNWNFELVCLGSLGFAVPASLAHLGIS